MTHDECMKINWRKVQDITTNHGVITKSDGEEFEYGADAEGTLFISLWRGDELKDWFQPEDVKSVTVDNKDPHMKFILKISCENCGMTSEYELKRTASKHSDTGVVYEDYASISDTINESKNDFSAHEFPDGTTITCGNCSCRYDLTT